MNILFRVDSSSAIGLGHLMRCLVLAQQYPKDTVIFACQDLTGNVNHKITQANYPIQLLKSNDSDELINLIKKLSIAMVVFDHYGIDYQFEKTIKQQTGVKILSIDDIYKPHYCDILLNHNIYAKNEHYKDLVPDFCEIRCGAKYTLIRDEFKQIKSKKRIINKENPTVFIAMGGADTANISLAVIKVLLEFGNITINLATTNANPNLNTLQGFADPYNNINIYINSGNIARLMNNSDFAIITPSVIVYEVMYLDLPFIAIKTADNQKYIYNYLMRNNFLTLEHMNKQELHNKINHIAI